MRNKPYAVLTGVLVKSSWMSSEQSNSAMERLRQLAKKFGSVYSDSTVSQFDTFWHDSWQWLLAKPELALRAAIFMRAGLRSHSVDCIPWSLRMAKANPGACFWG